MISFIVSSYERPLPLLTCISSILIQRDVEVIIVDNSNNPENIEMIMNFTRLSPDRVRYIGTKGLVPEEMRLGCYDPSALLGVPIAKGEWLCFPNDDSYYVPGFSEYMLRAAEEFGWEFIYCNLVYDPRHDGNTYSLVQGHLAARYITKSSFIIKKDIFNGFPPHERDWRDWSLAEEVNKRGIKHGCAQGILHVSN